MKLSETLRAQLRALYDQRTELQGQLDAVVKAPTDEGRDLTTDEASRFEAAQRALDDHDGVIAGLGERIANVERSEKAEADARARAEALGAGDATPVRVGSEPRTYTRENDRNGRQFLRDIASAMLGGDFMAQQRLARHMQEELVERGSVVEERAVGTGAFAGLTVPQYLVDLVAPNAKAGRPFANAINHHDLPESGMTVNISKITTGTDAAAQASENTAVQETNIDDTLLTINVLTVAGQQTVSRQALERGSGTEDVLMDDLMRSYHTRVDNKLINDASTGLTNAAGATVAYTDASPTVAELWPKLLDAASRVEAALLDQNGPADLAVMHSRRWYWLQSQVGTSWPFFSQPGIPTQAGGVNLAEAYGSGFRGVLPNGQNVVVDNNISTALGAGTEDEIYSVNSRECHLWEDPNAPMYIRAEQPAVASLGVLFVVYGYIAYTFTRYAGATAKIAGTGLIAPTF